ncbi:MAG: hypothetical protein JO020_03225 [Chloroflexi bacterium]|nr:hypothetical protein [Chloroflexota bacterium]
MVSTTSWLAEMTASRVLHHVARWYGYAVWLDEALPDEPKARYVEANQRFLSCVAQLQHSPPPADHGFYRNTGRQFSLEEMIDDVLACCAPIIEAAA